MKNEKIRDKVLSYINEFEQTTRARVIYVTVSGSKLYGTNNENSDTDIKGIFIPSKHSVLTKTDLDHYVRDTNTSKTKNSVDDVDFTLHSIYQFLGQLSKSETGAVDLLFSMFSDHVYKIETPESEIIKENYKYFLNSNMKSFIGYALGQTKKFGIKGARYDELDSFVTEYLNKIPTDVVDKSNKIGKNLFEDMKKFVSLKEYKYIKFIKAPGPRGSGNYDEIEYISVLGKLFEGNVNIPYFIDRVMKQYNQFGNRTKSTAKGTPKNNEILKELEELEKTI
jgi:predicted nucleotidyltransferase